MDAPDVSQEDCIVYAVGVLPLERFWYQSGKAQGGREFPVFKMVEDLSDDFHWKVWSCLLAKVGAEGFWRGRGRCVGDGRWLRAVFTWNRREVVCLKIVLSQTMGQQFV